MTLECFQLTMWVDLFYLDTQRSDVGTPVTASNVARAVEPYAGLTMAGGALGGLARRSVRWTTTDSGCDGIASGVAGPSSTGNAIGGGAAVPAAAKTQGAS